MKVLLTGASGFFGQEMKKHLFSLGHNVYTVGRSQHNQIQVDLGQFIPIISDPVDLVIHAAGKAHQIAKTEEERSEFFKVNSNGTANLLDALTRNKPKQFIFISTVAVYGREKGEGIDENTPLNGSTPYAKSKIMAEYEVLKWAEEQGVHACILRLPLIIGDEPPGNLGAMISAIKRGFYLRPGKGTARKSVVGISDLVEMIPKLMGKQGIYNLTDDQHPSIAELDSYIGRRLGKSIFSVPGSLLKGVARLGDFLPIIPLNSYKLTKLVSSLTFSNEKARKELGWNPRPGILSLLNSNGNSQLD